MSNGHRLHDIVDYCGTVIQCIVGIQWFSVLLWYRGIVIHCGTVIQCIIVVQWYSVLLWAFGGGNNLQILISAVLSNTLQVTLYNVHCTLYTVHCTLYTVHCTLYTVHCTLYTVRCTLYTVHCTLYTVHCTLYAVHCTLYTVNCTLNAAQHPCHVLAPLKRLLWLINGYSHKYRFLTGNPWRSLS